MSTQITFDDSKYKIRSRSLLGTSEVPTIIKFLVNKKIVKNENQAVATILCIVVLLIGVSAFLINNSVKIQPAIPSPTLNIK